MRMDKPPHPDTPCILSSWTNNVGYADHRRRWEKVNGPVPPGLELHHLCEVRRCVNVEHLTPVTSRTNKVYAGTIAKPACRRGHDMTDPANRLVQPSGTVVCRRCQYDANNAWAKRNKPWRAPGYAERANARRRARRAAKRAERG